MTFAGNLWLTSWGYKAELPVDDDKMMKLGRDAAAAIKAASGRVYKVGAAGKIFYPAGKPVRWIQSALYFTQVQGSEANPNIYFQVLSLSLRVIT